MKLQTHKHKYPVLKGGHFQNKIINDECSSGTTGTDTLEGQYNDDDGVGGADDEGVGADDDEDVGTGDDAVMRNHLDIK